MDNSEQGWEQGIEAAVIEINARIRIYFEPVMSRFSHKCDHS